MTQKNFLKPLALIIFSEYFHGRVTSHIRQNEAAADIPSLSAKSGNRGGDTIRLSRATMRRSQSGHAVVHSIVISGDNARNWLRLAALLCCPGRALDDDQSGRFAGFSCAQLLPPALQFWGTGLAWTYGAASVAACIRRPRSSSSSRMTFNR